MMKKKPFKYVFSGTEIEDFIQNSEECLQFEDFVTLIIDINDKLLRTHNIGNCSVLISKFSKNDKIIHTEKLELPLPKNTDFDNRLVLFSQEKPPKPIKNKEKQVNTNEHKDKNKIPTFTQVPIQTITMIGFIVLIVCVLGTSLTINQSINKANTQQTNLSQELLLSQLEADRRFDRAAKKMEEYGYSKKEIAYMYLDNEQFNSALKTDRSVLEDVLSKIDEYPYEEQKTSLEAITGANIVSKEDSPKIELRLALLNQDKGFLIENQTNIEEQELANRIVKFFLSEKDFEEAVAILKEFPNEELQKQVIYKQLETSLNEAIEAVNNKQKELDGKNEQLSNLNQQLDEINKNENEEERTQQAEEKQKEMNQATEEQKKITEGLENLKQAQENAQKALNELKE